MPLILHILFMLAAVVCLAVAASKRPEGGISFGWCGLFWWALDVLATAVVSYGR